MSIADQVRKAYKTFIWGWLANRPLTYEIRNFGRNYPKWNALIVAAIVAVAVVSQIASLMYLGLWYYGPWAPLVLLFWDFMAFVAGHIYFDTRGPYVRDTEYFK